MLQSARKARNVVMVCFEQAQILDITGPMQLFSAVRDAGLAGYAITLAAPDPGFITTTSGMRLGMDRAFDEIGDDLLADLDTLVVAGGDGTADALRDPRQIAFIRRAAQHARRIVSICSGIALIAQAGLARHKRVATHWNACDLIGAAFPDLRIDRDAIFVRDGNLWSSAGITAGMDLALAVIEEDWGHDVAVQVARRHVLFMIRPGGQSQFSVQLEAQAGQDGRLGKLLTWIADHPGADLNVPALAARACMSERTLARVFRAETGVTPAEFVERSRTEAARRDLEHTAHSIDRIAFDCGFGSMERMRRTFIRRLGVGPKAYRDRFRRLPHSARKEFSHEYRHRGL
ncbi:helix-turn-helix domain-containing protein [Emcibacter sp. SYSU 3D8]|uniref:GlxA family transcriptional regulator n=1 Tax=Emcibacter sp. SYSU 3D8 TaxID=3133969 RepID=UPI0031FED78E